MAQRITIDLNKNKDAASAVADLQPGDEVEVITTIVSKDDQSLVLEVEEVVESNSAEESEETPAEEAAEEGEGGDEKMPADEEV